MVHLAEGAGSAPLVRAIAELKKRNSGLCSEGARSASLQNEMRARLGIEWRWVISQGVRGE